MIIDYEHKHSGHCESGATAGLLKHNGLEISEPMAFGIGSGLYFTYMPFIKAQDAPLFAFRIRPGMVFRNTTRRLNVKTGIFKKFSDPGKAMMLLDDNLEKKIPTGLQVGMYHLKYFPAGYQLPYNFHNIVVFGKENDTYHISEPNRETTQLLTSEDLKKARFARGMFGPKGKMYYVLEVNQEPDYRKAIREAIKNTSFKMTKQRFPFIGVYGIKKLSKDMKKWPKKYPDEKAMFYLLQFVRSIEEFGTGGAGYRYMYGAFLKEAADLFKHDGLHSDAFRMGEIADLWRDFSYRSARFFKSRDDSGDNFLTLSDILMEIGNSEEKFFKEIGKTRL